MTLINQCASSDPCDARGMYSSDLVLYLTITLDQIQAGFFSRSAAPTQSDNHFKSNGLQGSRAAARERQPLPRCAIRWVPPLRPSERWSMDFMRGARAFRTLNVVDDLTRECAAMEVAQSNQRGRRDAASRRPKVARCTCSCTCSFRPFVPSPPVRSPSVVPAVGDGRVTFTGCTTNRLA